MSWADLASLGVTVRPLTDPKPPEGGRWSPFSASMTSTVEILALELFQLEAERVVVELDIPERMIRLDGLPRADARATHDGVAVSFQSKFGPLRYATAEFTARFGQPGWTQNLRAIALGMQALRAVDRYGVSKRGEQYVGWKAIAATSSEPEDLIRNAAQAREYLDEKYDGDLRQALFESHPDKGGSTDEFRKVMRVKELLGG